MCKHLLNLCVMLADIPLAKSSHMAKPRVNVGENTERHESCWYGFIVATNN